MRELLKDRGRMRVRCGATERNGITYCTSEERAWSQTEEGDVTTATGTGRRRATIDIRSFAPSRVPRTQVWIASDRSSPGQTHVDDRETQQNQSATPSRREAAIGTECEFGGCARKRSTKQRAGFEDGSKFPS